MPHRINDHACGVESALLRIAKVTVGEHTVRDVKVVRLDCGDDTGNGTRSKRNL